MHVTWYGHACFRLAGGGASVVMDPYTAELAGLAPVTEPADVVVTSSALDEAHANAAGIPGSPQVLNALDAVERPASIGGIVVEAIAAMEGVDRPDDPKANALYRFDYDGLAVCHMGDVGRRLTDAQLGPLRGRVDVLFALAGGGLTIDLDDLDDAIEQIAPRIVIPMHYRTPSILYDVGPLEDFLAHRSVGAVVRHEGSTMSIDAPSLPAERTVHVLRPACDPRAGG
jgi:L-ascorbate metabolism protein UlaG (beta-lactamase superfamily)